MTEVLECTPTKQAKHRLSLTDLRQPIEPELREFRAYFREAMRSDIMLLDKLVQYLLRSRGKEMRPMLVLLSAKMCGSVSETTYRGAALVELLHTATLVHDDVVDDSSKRRGRFSINALWKNKIAVLFGDFLLSRGLLLALDHKDYDLLHTMSTAVKRMSEGELLQLEKARKMDIDEDLYFRIISDKTASLISACTSAGAISVTGDESTRTAMRDLGENLGIAFQIRDDLFDYGVRDVGKPVGIDLKERKLTLPLIHTLKRASSSDRKMILKLIRKRRVGDAEVRKIGTMVSQYGGIDYAQSKMVEYATEASSIAETFPDSEAKNAMLDLIHYTIYRSH